MLSSSKRVVEICGLPGSGKTTLARQLESAGVSRVMIVTKYQILWNFFVGFVCRPVVTVRGLIFAIRHIDTLEEFWNFYVYRYARYNKAITAKSKVCILDEGPLQGVFSYASAGVDRFGLEEVINLIPKTHEFILLSVSDKIRWEQLEMRKDVRPESEFFKIKNRESDLRTAQELIVSKFKNEAGFVIAKSVEDARSLIQKSS